MKCLVRGTRIMRRGETRTRFLKLSELDEISTGTGTLARASLMKRRWSFHHWRTVVVLSEAGVSAKAPPSPGHFSPRDLEPLGLVVLVDVALQDLQREIPVPVTLARLQASEAADCLTSCSVRHPTVSRPRSATSDPGRGEPAHELRRGERGLRTSTWSASRPRRGRGAATCRAQAESLRRRLARACA